MNNGQPLLQTRDLVSGYGQGSKKPIPVAGPFEVDMHPGQLICLLGPNGSGKSTLLRTLAGLQPPLQGSLSITGIDSRHLSPAQLAKKISLVLTDTVRLSNLTVYALVALGRYPYSNWLGILQETDKAVIKKAIGLTGIESLLERKVATLSDGEIQKVMLARALTQDTPIMMLDEPTAHLDLPSRIQLMRLLHQLTRQTQKSILLSTHELDLALQVADEVWLLQSGLKRAAAPATQWGGLHKGSPEDLVLNGIFEAAFEKEGILFDKTTGAFTMHQGNNQFITIIGEGAAAFWTKRAVQRQGYNVTDLGLTPDIIRIQEENGRPYWILEQRDHSRNFNSLSDLLEALNQNMG